MRTREPHTQPWSRLDRVSWECHDEPPAAVNADRDRAAIRTITLYWCLSWGLAGWSVGAVLPSLFGIPTFDPPVLIVVFALAVVAAIGVQLRWRALRRETGYPIAPRLHDTLHNGVAVLCYFRDRYNLTSSDVALDLDARERGQFERGQRTLRRQFRGATAQLLLHIETVAAADRWGATLVAEHSARKVRADITAFWTRFAHLHPEVVADAAAPSDADEPAPGDRHGGP